MCGGEGARRSWGVWEAREEARPAAAYRKLDGALARPGAASSVVGGYPYGPVNLPLFGRLCMRNCSHPRCRAPLLQQMRSEFFFAHKAG